jgi:hypothetical protein
MISPASERDGSIEPVTPQCLGSSRWIPPGVALVTARLALLPGFYFFAGTKKPGRNRALLSFSGIDQSVTNRICAMWSSSNG